MRSAAPEPRYFRLSAQANNQVSSTLELTARVALIRQVTSSVCAFHLVSMFNNILMVVCVTSELLLHSPVLEVSNLVRTRFVRLNNNSSGGGNSSNISISVSSSVSDEMDMSNRTEGSLVCNPFLWQLESNWTNTHKEMMNSTTVGE